MAGLKTLVVYTLALVFLIALLGLFHGILLINQGSSSAMLSSSSPSTLWKKLYYENGMRDKAEWKNQVELILEQKIERWRQQQGGGMVQQHEVDERDTEFLVDEETLKERYGIGNELELYEVTWKDQPLPVVDTEGNKIEGEIIEPESIVLALRTEDTIKGMRMQIGKDKFVPVTFKNKQEDKSVVEFASLVTKISSLKLFNLIAWETKEDCEGIVSIATTPEREISVTACKIYNRIQDEIQRLAHEFGIEFKSVGEKKMEMGKENGFVDLMETKDENKMQTVVVDEKKLSSTLSDSQNLNEEEEEEEEEVEMKHGEQQFNQENIKDEETATTMQFFNSLFDSHF